MIALFICWATLSTVDGNYEIQALSCTAGDVSVERWSVSEWCGFYASEAWEAGRIQTECRQYNGEVK